jgi:hypothetical protein
MSPQSRGREFPHTLTFDPRANTLPPPLELGGEPGPLFLVLDVASDRRWAAEAAIALASGWARAGRRVVLADLHFEEPVLHEHTGEANADGIVDIFLYGASLARSARPVPGHAFYLIPAGTYTPDAGAVFRHARWSKLVAGFRDANASLLLFVRGDAPDVDALMEWAEEAIVLGEEARAAALLDDLPAGVAVRAIVAPPVIEALPDPDSTLEYGLDIHVAPAIPVADMVSEAAETDTFDSVEASASAEDDVVTRVYEISTDDVGAPAPSVAGYKTSAPLEAPPSVSGTAADEVGAPADAQLNGPRAEDDTRWIEPATPARMGPRSRRSRRRGGTPPVVWVLLGIAGLAAAGYLVAASDLFENRRDVSAADDTRVDTATAAPAAAAARPAPPPAPVPRGAPLHYAVQVKAFTSLPAAREQVLAEQRRFADAPFYISPERVQGILYYKVLAGLPADSTAATALRQRLVDVGAIDPDDATGSWNLIQYAPLAFHLGEFPTREAAVDRADSLLAQGIPSYPVTVLYSDGTERWRLYGGAFRERGRADGMRELLNGAGVQAELLERVGQPVAAAR